MRPCENMRSCAIMRVAEWANAAAARRHTRPAHHAGGGTGTCSQASLGRVSGESRASLRRVSGPARAQLGEPLRVHRRVRPVVVLLLLLLLLRLQLQLRVLLVLPQLRLLLLLELLLVLRLQLLQLRLRLRLRLLVLREPW